MNNEIKLITKSAENWEVKLDSGKYDYFAWIKCPYRKGRECTKRLIIFVLMPDTIWWSQEPFLYLYNIQITGF